MGDILGKVPFYVNGRQRKKEDSDERNDNTFIFFAGFINNGIFLIGFSKQF